jgi:two-component system NtrC family response regulator
MVQEGRFREDLLFRLRTLLIGAPPLRELLEDIKKLTHFYMKDLCERFGVEPKGASPEFWEIVTEYKWPGNVRELVHALEKALLSQRRAHALPKTPPTYIRIQVAQLFLKRPTGRGEPEIFSSGPKASPKLKEVRKAAVSEAERRYLKDLLSFVDGDSDKACRISGLSRSRFYTLLRKHRPASGA